MKILRITNTVLSIIGFTYGIYLLPFDGKINAYLISILAAFIFITGIINFKEKQKTSGIFMFIIATFFIFNYFCSLSTSCYFNNKIFN